MKKFALIVAGGTGIRMDSKIPKQFLVVAGRPLLMHTILCFYRYDQETEIILVLPPEQVDSWEALCSKYAFIIRHHIVEGGKTRFQSVQNGLSVIREDGIVFIHDGVRPLVSAETIQRCYDTAIQNGNAIPVLPVTESLRFVEGKTSRAVERENLVAVQTPQTFLVSQIKQAYRRSYKSHFTDDASVVDDAGYPVSLVEGNGENIKITYPSDLYLAGLLLSDRH